jgi:hypothetical protein
MHKQEKQENETNNNKKKKKMKKKKKKKKNENRVSNRYIRGVTVFNPHTWIHVRVITTWNRTKIRYDT